MGFKADRFQKALGILFALSTIFTCGSRVEAGKPGHELFFTPSVEPVGLQSVQSTPVPEAVSTIWTGGPVKLERGEIIRDPAELPPLASILGREEFGAASVSGRTDKMVIWITRDGETLYQVVSADNPALYGPRDPVAGNTLGFGYFEELQKWQAIHEKRSELMAGWVGALSSSSGSGAAAAGGFVASKAGGLGLFLGAVDILGGMMEHYLNAGRTYFAMLDSQRDLSSLFDEAQAYEIQR